MTYEKWEIPCFVCSFYAGLLCAFSLFLSFKSDFFLLHTHFFLFHNKTQLVSCVIPLFCRLREFLAALKVYNWFQNFLPRCHKHISIFQKGPKSLLFFFFPIIPCVLFIWYLRRWQNEENCKVATALGFFYCKRNMITWCNWSLIAENSWKVKVWYSDLISNLKVQKVGV